ncbi:glycosyltransferase [Bombella sp. ESL0378]|uniref:glycosyltransferase n=1 Tax=unclassified Bombella TaxID=2644098 RepID=UPI0012D94F0D|nr:glycosyltransferase [Bombella sp. ESL0378]MUG89443.1 glycosyltransferase [Bombella sp. ESL0385]
MGRIIFLNCFPRDCITGGVKTTYRHALLLRRAGFEVQVMQPDGPPSWLDREMAALICSDVTNLTANDLIVFPETLNGWYSKMIRAPLQGKKVIFCQNPYYFFTYGPSKQNLKEWGVQYILSPGAYCTRMIQSVLGVDNVLITPPVVDGTLFTPQPKSLQIVVSYRKWVGQENVVDYAGLMREMLHLKYPQFTHISWIALQNNSEAETADIMGRSAIVLSLGRLESLGITALEAMAAGCCVVGYHGGGGIDYATAQNGFWHSPEDVEGVVDSLARAITGFSSGDPLLPKMLEAGHRAAQAYAPERVSATLKQVYSQLLNAGE